MGKITGFMEFERLEQAHEPVKQRKTHFREFITPLNPQQAKKTGSPLYGLRNTLLHIQLSAE